jgi:hypothetical protein
VIEVDIDAARKTFADLTALLEDGALTAAEGQGLKDRRGIRLLSRRLRRIANRLNQRLTQLERFLE